MLSECQDGRSIQSSGLSDMNDLEYDTYIEAMRRKEYPMLQDTLYLDHAGATLTAKSVMDKFHAAMTAEVYGNPHSFSRVAYRTAGIVERTRLKVLQMIKADPEQFDIVFTANATSAIKLVGEAFSGLPTGFEYAYHSESHTSLVGLRELASHSRCLFTDQDARHWFSHADDRQAATVPALFAIPAQSNLNGRKVPLAWPTAPTAGLRPYVLLDAAAYAATSGLDFSNTPMTADFTVLSLYKIFGFPDLGALVVKKSAGHVFNNRKYFGGGTVDLVTTGSAGPGHGTHMPKTCTLHERLEDGTPPFHNIIALDAAIDIHHKLFQSFDRISRHTSFLAQRLFRGLRNLTHGNGLSVTRLYTQGMLEPYSERDSQGPSVAFNLRSSSGDWVSNHEFEKLAWAKNVNVRTGTLCNPGGSAQLLDLSATELHANYTAGHRCGSELDIINSKPTGMIRVSLGAMSTTSDVDRFLAFIQEFYVDVGDRTPVDSAYDSDLEMPDQALPLSVESLTVYPIKSCAGWQPPSDMAWSIRPEGLEWDREWCIVHTNTLKALSQKRYSRMVLIRPQLDLEARLLKVQGIHASNGQKIGIEVPLDAATESALSSESAEVCGEECDLEFYRSPAFDDFFTDCLGVPCRLARFPDLSKAPSARHAKPHLVNRGISGLGRTIALSNESPILTITRASLDRLNEQIKARHGKAAAPAVFRANLVLAHAGMRCPGTGHAYAEDDWTSMRIGGHSYDFLGGCRRCHMVCIDQSTCEKNAEPLATLAKTRRMEGKVVFGVHTALVAPQDGRRAYIRVGDQVQVT